jgi:hypothetical protein
MRFAVEERECGCCGSVLRELSSGVVTCSCDQTMYGGMVSIRPDGSAACYGCGWTGIPTFVRGRASTHCPSCEGFGDESDLREQPLAYDIFVRRDGVFRKENGRLVRCGALKPQAPKQRRNELCACGSGLKWKKCCMP